MELQDFLSPSLIYTDLVAQDKEDALRVMAQHLAAAKPSLDAEVLLQLLLERESLSTTGIGFGVAVPHCKSDQVQDLTILVARSLEGIDFQALDGQPCRLFFLLIAPTQSSNTHLKALAKIARFAKDAAMREGLLAQTDPGSLLRFIAEQEQRFN